MIRLSSFMVYCLTCVFLIFAVYPRNSLAQIRRLQHNNPEKKESESGKSFTRPPIRKQYNNWLEQIRGILGVDDLHSVNVSLLYTSSKDHSKEETETHLVVQSSLSPVQTVSSLGQEWVDRVAKHILILRPSKSIVDGLVTATTNLMRGYFSAIHIMISYPMETWNQQQQPQPQQHWDVPHASSEYDIYTPTPLRNSVLVMALLKDTLLGIFSGFLVMGTAVATSMYQIMSGLEGSMEGIRASALGLTWDENQRRYIYYSLDRDALQTNDLMEHLQHIQKKSQQQHDDDKKSKYNKNHLRNNKKKVVKDSSFYQLLNVPVDASNHQIKQAYHRQAIKLHPDKNPLDKHATHKFQLISSVYQTLLDDDAREAYDTYGKCYRNHHPIVTTTTTSQPHKEGPMSMPPQIDPAIFFMLLFDIDDTVKPYVGELSIISMVDQLLSLIGDTPLKTTTLSSLKLNRNNYTSYSSLQQRKRQIDIAKFLRSKILLKGNDSSLDSFRSYCRLEAWTIRQGEFGDAFLSIIGSTLVSASQEFLGYRKSVLGIRGMAFYAKKSFLSFFQNLSTTYHIGKTIQVSIQAYLDARRDRSHTTNFTSSIPNNKPKQVKNDTEPWDDWNCDSNNNHKSMDHSMESFSLHSRDIQVMIRKLESSIPSILELGWKINTQDIQYTIHEACKKLFGDTTVSPTEREMMARDIQILGEEFVKVSQDEVNRRTNQKSTSTHDNYVTTIKIKMEHAFRSSIFMVRFSL